MPPSRDGKKTRVTPLEQIYREIAILKKLNHPNVVKLYEVSETTVFLIQKFLLLYKIKRTLCKNKSAIECYI